MNPQPPAPQPQELLKEVLVLARADRQGDIEALVSGQWPSIQKREPTAYDAESCRIAMLACFKQGKFYEGALWRVRALVRAAASGWMDGVAALIQTEALRIQAIENDGRPTTDDEYVVVPQALEILEELRPFISDAGPESEWGPAPCGRFHARTYYEKRGILLEADRRYSEALEAYEQALALTANDERGRLKVGGEHASCLYLSTEDPDVRATASRDTERIAGESHALGHAEIARIASENATRMRSGRRDLMPYEVL